MEYLFSDEHLDLCKEQVWEAKSDMKIYGLLSEFELEQFQEYLPRECKRSFEFGAGMGRGSIQLHKIYGNDTEYYLADRQGRTSNKGVFFPQDDEFYNDFDLTRSFCELNGLKDFQVFDTELDDWSRLPKFDLITSRCSLGFHVKIDRYIDRLISIAAPEVTMIFGVNRIVSEESEDYLHRFKEWKLIPGKEDHRLPLQSWLILKGLDSQ